MESELPPALWMGRFGSGMRRWVLLSQEALKGTKLQSHLLHSSLMESELSPALETKSFGFGMYGQVLL
jgi:hypothetical protein